MEEPNILIKSALNEAVQKVNEGMTPTEALKKVAVELDLNPNYIQRTGEALNVALHYKHFKTAADRSSEFDIADIPNAIEQVFTINEKTAAEYTSEHFPASAEDTVFNYNRILTNPKYKQAFLEIANATETQESYPPTFNTVYSKAANYIDKLQKEASEAHVASAAAEFSLNEKFSEIADEFKKDASYRTAFEEFESQVFSKHGQAAVPYLDLLHKTAAQHEDRGVHDSHYIMFTPCKEAMLFDALMNAAKDYIDTAKTAEELDDNLSYEYAYLKEAHKAMGKKSEDFSAAASKEPQSLDSLESSDESGEEDEEPADPVLAQIKKKASASPNKALAQDPVLEHILEKEAFFGSIGGLLSKTKIMDRLVSTPAGNAFSNEVESMFAPKSILNKGPKPNLTLDNMERKLLLQELMLTDPILSKVNPAKVARAFEQILRLSPEISKEKEVVRAELRAMVSSQALSKYDADLMTKLDVGMLKRRIATQQFNKGFTDNFKF